MGWLLEDHCADLAQVEAGGAARAERLGSASLGEGRLERRKEFFGATTRARPSSVVLFAAVRADEKVGFSVRHGGGTSHATATKASVRRAARWARKSTLAGQAAAGLLDRP